MQCQVVLVEISMQFLCAEYTCNLDQLIVVVLTIEEGLFAENHTSQHTSKAPQIQTVVIQLHIHQKLRSLEAPRCNTHIVLCAWVIKVSESPIDQA